MEVIWNDVSGITFDFLRLMYPCNIIYLFVFYVVLLRALLRSRKEIPAERVRHLEKILSGHYGNEKITDHLLVKAAMLNTM